MKRLLLILMLCLCSSYSNLYAVDNNDSSYLFFFNGDSLVNSMKKVAKNNGYSLYISQNIPDKTLNKKIYGKIKSGDFQQFMDLLSKQYGFDWFMYSDKLYIVGLEDITQSINVSSDNMQYVKDYINEIGLLLPKYSFSEFPGQNRIIITGPRDYVALVKNIILNLKVSNSTQQFAIYHLKYANAVDTQLNFNGQTINVPGVASIVAGLIGTGVKNPSFNALNDITTPLSNKAKKAASEISTAKNANGGGDIENFRSMPKIEADARLNSIIVWDNANNLRLYRNIIKELDVPTPIIQIDVLIVKIDQDKLAQNGINWWGSYNGAGGGFGTANLTSGPTNSLVASYGQVNPGQLLITNLASFTSSLEFLETNQYAKTLAKPSLATIDNLPAMTNTVENIFAANVGTNNISQSNTNNPNNFAYNGMQLIQSLSITPHVIFIKNNKNRIRLTIAMQDGSIDNFSNPLMPNYSQGQINSQAVINEGQSIVLAGYTKSENIKVENKVPFFGDIPVIGWLFKNTNTTVHRVTTMYVVTPKIIYNSIATPDTDGKSTTTNASNSDDDTTSTTIINSINKAQNTKQVTIQTKDLDDDDDDSDDNDDLVNNINATKAGNKKPASAAVSQKPVAKDNSTTNDLVNQM